MEIAELESRLEELHPASFAWALGCCGGDRAEAEEVLQTTYLKILDGRARFGERSSLKTWLFAVIRRTARSRGRRRAVRRALLERWRESTPPPRVRSDPAARLGRAERAARVRRALAGLSRRQREVLELVFFHELSVREAAEVMGVGLGSARVHYDRGKKRVLQRLEKLEGPGRAESREPA